MFDLSGKKAVVTGAGTGIGQGISEALAKAGADVCVHYNSSEAGASETLGLVRAHGRDGFLFKADLSRREGAQDLMAAVSEHFGGADILVNNAAYQPNKRIEGYDRETFMRVFNVNFGGYFLCMQAALPYLKINGGRIINISSVHGKRPAEFDAAYAMTKGAIRMLTREAALEFFKYGITVNAIEPGGVALKNGKSGVCDPWIEEHMAEIPFTLESIKGYGIPAGMPSDVGALAVFIASDEAKWLNGSGIRMDGGAMLT